MKKIGYFVNTSWFASRFCKSLANDAALNNYDITFILADDLYVDEFRGSNYKFVYVPMSRSGVNIIEEISTILSVRRVLKELNLDLLHSQTIKPCIYGFLASAFTNLQVINSYTGLGYAFSSGSFKARFARLVILLMIWILSKFDRVGTIVLNKDDYNFFSKFYKEFEKKLFLVHGSGIDTATFSPNYEKSKRFSNKILFVGRLLIDKGVQEFVDASEILKISHPEIQMLIAGDLDKSNPASINESQVLNWKSKINLKFLGQVEDMSSLYNSVDICVLPSYREGLPTAMAEAASCGLPVIVTDVEGCRDVVIDGITGLLIPVRDAKALANAIIYLCEHPQISTHMGHEGRIFAESKFSNKVINQKILDVYSNALRGL
jgi:glycosyltransferase involved in cell wall biosynthesis